MAERATSAGTERTDPATAVERGDSVPVVRKSTAGKTITGLAAAGRWAGESGRGRGWEDYLAEFLAALLVWGGIGYLLDRWLGTGPWLLIAGLVLGNSLGIYLLWLRSNADVTPEQRAAEARWRQRSAGVAGGAEAASGEPAGGGDRP